MLCRLPAHLGWVLRPPQQPGGGGPVLPLLPWERQAQTQTSGVQHGALPFQVIDCNAKLGHGFATWVVPLNLSIPLPSSDGYKQIMPYDLYHPLPRYVPDPVSPIHLFPVNSLRKPFLVLFDRSWESSPWTACSTSCGGGVQSRSVSCVEEDMQGVITTTDEWKCLYSPKTPVLQPCNAFDCPVWLAQEWSPVGGRFLISKVEDQCVQGHLQQHTTTPLFWGLRLFFWRCQTFQISTLKTLPRS